MKTTSKSDRAFTLVELLVVIAVIGVLAGLLLPVLSAAKGNAKRTTCLNNLKEVNQGTSMYYDDSNDASPAPNHSYGTPLVYYKERMKNYVGLHGRSSPQDKIFACPADTFYYQDWTNGSLRLIKAPEHEQADLDYGSYWFNGMNMPRRDPPRPGIAGVRITSIKEPAKTVLVAETPALFCKRRYCQFIAAVPSDFFSHNCAHAVL